MLRFFQSIPRREMVPFVLIALICLLLASSVSHCPIQDLSAQAATDNNSGDDGPWWIYSGFWIACFTLITLFVFFGQLWIMWRTDRHFRVSERAYTKMSHDPPGIVWSGDDVGRFWVSIQIKNFGRTPAIVRFLSLKALVVSSRDALPKIPGFGKAVERGAFLVADDKYATTTSLRMSPDERDDIISGTKYLAVIGYVDYIDLFDTYHRAGYGRWYDPRRDDRPEHIPEEDFAQRTNLIYIEDPGYNYDIQLAP